MSLRGAWRLVGRGDEAISLQHIDEIASLHRPVAHSARNDKI
jgi:hypothetical protein